MQIYGVRNSGGGGFRHLQSFQGNDGSFFPKKAAEKGNLSTHPICSYIRIIKGPATGEIAYFWYCVAIQQFRQWYCARVYGEYTFGKLGRIPNFPHFLRRAHTLASPQTS